MTLSISHVGQRQALVGHEHLERGVAVVDQRRQLLAEHALGRVGDDEMERDVDVAMAVGLGVIVLHHLAQDLPLLLHGERQHHGVAAERRRARAGVEIVGHDDAGAGRLREMHVAVDAAGQHQHAARVDDLGRAPDVSPSAAIRPPLMPTSQAKVSDAVATVPPRIARS